MKKLQLKKEVVARLDNDQMSLAKGGAEIQVKPTLLDINTNCANLQTITLNGIASPNAMCVNPNSLVVTHCNCTSADIAC